MTGTQKAKQMKNQHCRKITVSEIEIAEGKACLGAVCPISMAIKRCRPEATNVTVDLQKIAYTVMKQNKRLWFLTPKKAQQFIVDFDLGADVEPFQFSLNTPAWEILRKSKNEGDMVKVVVPKEHTRSNGKIHSRKITIRGGSKPPVSNPGAKRRVYGICALKLNKEALEQIMKNHDKATENAKADEPKQE